MDLLVLGGTVFVGRHVVQEALARGHRVTVFHRGQHGEDAHGAAVEHVHGDRTTDLHLLAGQRWDAVVDTCGFDGPTVAASVAAIDAGHYGFVSSVSVYAHWPAVAIDETSPVKEPDDPEDSYGAGKVAAERALPDGAFVTRPGLIVGPYENIGRLPYWLRRVARGGEVLAPGDPAEPRQWVDARDLAALHVTAAEQRLAGTYDTVGPAGQFTMGELLDACRDVTGSDATFTWVDGPTVTAAGIAPWTGLPLWLWSADEDVSHTWDVDASAARAAGMPTTPMRQTVEETWAWVRAGADLGGYRGEYAVRDVDPATEAKALGRQ